MSQEIKKVKNFIIGSGPAGYTAAIYSARADLAPIMYQGDEPGGQLTKTTDVENFPGYPDPVEGPAMMEDMKMQAERVGADIRWGKVNYIDLSKRPYHIKTDDGKEFLSDTVIIATGAQAKYLGLPSEQEYNGGGVSACATCDGFFYKGKKVAVVGGGDTACEDALYLANMTEKVYMIVRRDEFRASKIMQNRVLKNDKIEVLWNTNTLEILGKKEGFIKEVTGARLLNNKTNEEFEIQVSGFFIAIGHTPVTGFLNNQVKLDEKGYIITEPGSTQTNLEGVFAAGDVQDSVFRQAITAAGTGCMAAMEAERYLQSLED
jgi:thioredoxin reductase (NADPH)